MSAPIPFAAELAPSHGLSALLNPSTSKDSVPPPKRQRPDDPVAASDAPVAAVNPPVVAPPPAEEPPADEKPPVGEVDISPLDVAFVVFGNDTDEGKIIKSVLAAAHSRLKPEKMLRSAFPFLTEPDIDGLVQIPCHDVFRFKKGGNKAEAMADAKEACGKIIELADTHGSKLRLWGCGGGVDRIVQISSLTGFVQADNMRPLNGAKSPRMWQELGIRNSECVSNGRCASVNLTSSSNGTGTYRGEIWRNGVCTTHFFLGVYPHPGVT